MERLYRRRGSQVKIFNQIEHFKSTAQTATWLKSPKVVVPLLTVGAIRFDVLDCPLLD